ncbi:ATP-binding cassette domain-containing protein [Streptomyces sp. H27-D2]|uniref:ATP-binding cassette domain-containing protein n=1 Tax=Streptomyces sp. H27-D2 TaxID=3046304 RepID=UPI002DB9FCC2|nr:ATP-binding cassette domain-containing protein [Streptomyces sp. H27-D2]MEC4015385.1 ATP-binding cassette domain-containing protein [Streptomyces sp. H27-D2]
MSTSRPLVGCRDVARTFGRGPAALVAVHGTSCQVHPGDRIAITGPSGSGKSTLLHLLAGLEQPTSGDVRWPRFPASRAGRARDIGVVFQSPSLIPVLGVSENAALPLVLAGVPEPQARRRTAEALARVGVRDLASKLPDELSGGQAQRVAVARALALRPRIILADEPTGQLDRASARHVIDVLLDAARELGAALVVATHDPAVSVRLRTRWQMIGRHLEAGLRGSGYTCAWSRTGASGLAHARGARLDVVLLDLGLPDIDGVDVARQLRSEHPDLLVIILTARSDEIDVIVGLDAGADDYLVKPFSLSVLLARLRAHLRRRIGNPDNSPPLRLGDLTLDITARRCLLGEREVTLRPKEFELLAILARNEGAAVSRETLMSQVWDENWFGSTKTLDVTMASLRRRLHEAAAARPARLQLPDITTLRGHGYRLQLSAPSGEHRT